MAQDNLEGSVIKRNDGLPTVFGNPIETGLVGLRGMLQQLRTHHGGECERDDGRNQNRYGQGDRELAKEPSDNVAHKEERNEDGDQRYGERNDGETNLLRAFQRRLKWRLAL